MKKVIDFFIEAQPFDFVCGLLIAACVIGYIYEIIFKQDD